MGGRAERRVRLPQAGTDTVLVVLDDLPNGVSAIARADIGQIVDVGGLGALRKVRIRFANAGEKTFVADKVKLKAVAKK